MEALRFLSAEGTVKSKIRTLSFDETLQFVHIEDLCAPIVEGLLGLLRERHAGVLFATSTVLGFLTTDSMSSLPLLVSHTEGASGWERVGGTARMGGRHVSSLIVSLVVVGKYAVGYQESHRYLRIQAHEELASVMGTLVRTPYRGFARVWGIRIGARTSIF